MRQGGISVFTSLSIKNFRCFSDFTIEPLERVNLITGENNSGKTALLEAVFLVAGGNNLSRWERINAYRGMGSLREMPYSLSRRRYESDPLSAGLPFWRHTFRNLDSTKAIQISVAQASGIQHRTQLRVLDAGSVQLPLDREIAQPQNMIVYDLFEPTMELVYLEPSGETHATRVSFEADTGRMQRFDDDGRPIRRAVPRHMPFPGFFLPPSRRNSSEADARRLGRLVASKQPYSLLDALRIIEPRLRKLAPVPTADGSFIYADIGLDEMLDLRLMGDGLVHLTSILLHIASAAGGIVLIDEIENGLHHSSMHKVWLAIAAAARQFNTQVLATTHSYECIWAAHESFAGSVQYDFHLHRLDRVDDKIGAFTYDQETLASSVKADLEVR